MYNYSSINLFYSATLFDIDLHVDKTYHQHFPINPMFECTVRIIRPQADTRVVFSHIFYTMYRVELLMGL